MPSISEQDLNRLRASVEELTALNEIATAINLSISVETITRIILENCLKRIPAAQGAVFLIDDGSGDTPMFHTFIRETAESSEALPLRLNWSLLGWMTKSKRLLAMNDPVEDERFPGINFKNLGITSLLAAPLIAKSGLIGALTLFNKKTTEGFTSEDKRFLGIVGTQTAQVVENARLLETEYALRAIEEEMKVAKSIQEGYLPQGNIVTDHFEILGYNRPAKEVGGDYYDMFFISEHEVVLSIGDVAGKGIPASLLASEAQAVIRSLLRHSPRPTLPDLVDSLNRLFVEMTRPDQYITAFIAIYDTRDRVLRYVNAGHLPPLVISSSGITEITEGVGLVVGALEDTHYELSKHQLRAGDTLFVCTDGIIENFGPGDEEYSEARLQDFLVRHHGAALASTRDDLVAELTTFRQGIPQSDDITFLTLRTK